jgi:PAS domain S-box-containing protein
MGRGRETSAGAAEREPLPLTGLLLLVTCALVYSLVSDRTGRPVAAFALPALLVGTTRGPRTTAWVGALCAAVAVGAVALDEGIPSASFTLRLVVVIAAIGLGVAGSARRVGRERQLAVAAARSDELRGRLDAISQALRAGRLGTWTWERASGRVVWDHDLERLYGLEPGAFGGTFDEWMALVHPDDRTYARGLVERSVSTEGEFSFEHRCIWPDGSVHWLGGVGEPVLDEDGRLTGAVGVAADIDDRRAADQERRRVLELERREHERSAYLASASQALASSLDLDELLDRITDAAVPALADWCRFTLVLDDGEVKSRTAVANADPEIVALTRRLEQEQPLRPEARIGAARVMATGETVFTPRIDESSIDELFDDPWVSAAIKRLRMRSVVTVPVRNPSGIIGALQLVRNEDSPPYTEADVPVAEELATTIGIALNNAELFRRQRDARRALDILQQLSGRLAVAATVDDVAEAAVVNGAAALGADTAYVYMLAGDELTLARQTGHDDADHRAWRRIPVDDPTPATDALREDVMVLVESLEEMRSRYPGLSPRNVSLIAIPMRVRSHRVGALVLGFDRRRSFRDEEQAMLATFAARCAGAIERARLYEAQRDASLTLQRRMLPELPPDAPWLAAAAHYRPATGGEVGGDWYQLLTIDDDRIALVLGDAVGRGIPAAAAMGQLRGVVTGAASVEPDPERVVEATDRFARLGSDTTGTSMVYALVDRRDDRLRYVSAGHLPGALLRHDGEVELLCEGRRPLLGSIDLDRRWPVASSSFAVGDTLVLFTDGLVERRSEDIDAGLDRLVRTLRALAPLAVDVTALCDRLVDDLVGTEAIDDDIAVLVARRVG